MTNPVTQFQILSKEPEACAKFFGDLFGWTVHSANPMGYRQIDTGSREGIQGGIWPAPPQAPEFAQLFISVADVKGVCAKAQNLGARVLIPPTALPDGDEMAVLHDPRGLPFAVWSGKRA